MRERKKKKRKEGISTNFLQPIQTTNPTAPSSGFQPASPNTDSGKRGGRRKCPSANGSHKREKGKRKRKARRKP
jgi:hypothetical protein